jgi:hypothetical protein
VDLIGQTSREASSLMVDLSNLDASMTARRASTPSNSRGTEFFRGK